MKKVLLIITMIAAALSLHAQDEEGEFAADDLLATLKTGDKAALLMVHFGTTYDDTRALTIDAINARATEAFPELDVHEAYTSRMIIRKLARQGVVKKTPLEALLALRTEGYTHVLVQSTHLLDGVEMESLRCDVQSVVPFFEEIRLGTPLLYSTDDSQRVVDILTARHAPDTKKREHVMLIGHGTYTPATATYSQIDYMLHASGQDNIHVATIEGYPTFDDALARVKAARGKSVVLVPMMFVAGDHARNDIAVDLREAIEQEGISATACMEGLGQIIEIQDLYIDHIRFALTHRQVSIMEKKAVYYKQ